MSDNTVKSGALTAAILALPICALLAILQGAQEFNDMVEDRATQQAAVVEANGRAALDYATARQIDALTEIAVNAAKSQQLRATLMEVRASIMMVGLLVGLLLLLIAVVALVIAQQKMQYEMRQLTRLAANGLLPEDDGNEST